MAKSETQNALFEAIEKNLQDLVAERAVNVLQRNAAIERLARAYRYVAGGAQPGGVGQSE